MKREVGIVLGFWVIAYALARLYLLTGIWPILIASLLMAIVGFSFVLAPLVACFFVLLIRDLKVGFYTLNIVMLIAVATVLVFSSIFIHQLYILFFPALFFKYTCHCLLFSYLVSLGIICYYCYREVREDESAKVG